MLEKLELNGKNILRYHGNKVKISPNACEYGILDERN